MDYVPINYIRLTCCPWAKYILKPIFRKEIISLKIKRNSISTNTKHIRFRQRNVIAISKISQYNSRIRLNYSRIRQKKSKNRQKFQKHTKSHIPKRQKQRWST